MQIIEDVDLSTLTTLAVGGPARRLVRFDDPAQLPGILEEVLPGQVAVLGSGSNLIVADRGFDGLLLQSVDTTRMYDPGTGELQAGAGLGWDDLVGSCVAEGAAGVECLSGIPGLCGAAPVQNIGAYGQEVGEVLAGLTAIDLRTGAIREFSVDECGLGYRRSRFKVEDAGRWMITSIRLALSPGGPPCVRYAELERALAGTSAPDLARVRAAVLELRAGKSMLYDPDDPNHRSAGSFFTNPVITSARFDRLREESADELPGWPAGEGNVKVPAAWLIQHAGFEKGHTRGRAGLSTRHVLALVNRGGASAAELIALARDVRDRVLDRFGIRLRPEPVPLGFEDGEVDDLWGDQDA